MVLRILGQTVSARPADHERVHSDQPDDRRLLLLDSADNVFVVRVALRAGETVLIAGQPCAVVRDVPVGFKVARCDLEEGQKVIKYGAVIGSATKRIVAGDVIHTDNMQSDYIAPHINANAEDIS